MMFRSTPEARHRHDTPSVCHGARKCFLTHHFILRVLDPEMISEPANRIPNQGARDEYSVHMLSYLDYVSSG